MNVGIKNTMFIEQFTTNVHSSVTQMNASTLSHEQEPLKTKKRSAKEQNAGNAK